MKRLMTSFFLLLSSGAYASTDLSQMMGSTCETLGPIAGTECVKLQRQLESENVVLDLNGATACSLIWQWGSHSDNLHIVKDKVLGCFKQVANLRISDEVRDTCEGPFTNELEGFASVQKALTKTNKMMECIKQLGVPVLSSRR